jgi:hypothetical protein
MRVPAARRIYIVAAGIQAGESEGYFALSASSAFFARFIIVILG